MMSRSRSQGTEVTIVTGAFSSHGFNLLLLSWISLLVCVLTFVSIVCLYFNCCFYCLSVF